MPAAKAKTVKKKKGAARKRAAPGASLVNALAEAAWAEADAALAEALAYGDEAVHASDAASRVEALTLLNQALGRAARKRGLTRIGALGGRVGYDSEIHDLTEPRARKPKTVSVIARGVARAGKTLVKARVKAPVRRTKRP